jgi:hypothetical protein
MRNLLTYLLSFLQASMSDYTVVRKGPFQKPLSGYLSFRTGLF